MDKEFSNILGAHKHKGSTTRQLTTSLDLSASIREINNYDVIKVISAAQQANEERIASNLYRIHGTINCVGPVISKKQGMSSLLDLFGEGRDAEYGQFYDYFDVFVGYVSKLTPLSGNLYTERIKILSKLSDFEVMECGFAKNIFNDKIHSFVMNEGYDLTDARTEEDVEDGFVLPVTELVLYFKAKPAYTERVFTSYSEYRNASADTVYGFNQADVTLDNENAIIQALDTYVKPTSVSGAYGVFIVGMVTHLFKKLNIGFTADNVQKNRWLIVGYIQGIPQMNYTASTGPNAITIGSEVIGGIVEFDKGNFNIRRVEEQRHCFDKRITIPIGTVGMPTKLTNLQLNYTTTGTDYELDIKMGYNPFVRIPIRAYSSFIETADTATTGNLPYYAVSLDGGVTSIWRDLLDVGYIEPISEVGINYPFVNNSHYLFCVADVILTPEMTQNNAFKIYKNYLLESEVTGYKLS
jgi:hypothetical protein